MSSKVDDLSPTGLSEKSGITILGDSGISACVVGVAGVGALGGTLLSWFEGLQLFY